LPFFSPGRAKKRHSFHDWRIGRREALSTPEARKGRGSEHGGFYAARSCTSGVDRRSRTEPRVRREMNVEPEVQPKAAPHCFSGSALRAGDRPAWMGSVERQFHRRSQRGKGGASFPQKNHLLIAEFGTCTSRCALNGKDSSRAWQDRVLGHPCPQLRAGSMTIVGLSEDNRGARSEPHPDCYPELARSSDG
jgi:hypothetical protein